MTGWEVAFVLVDDFYSVVDARISDLTRTEFFRDSVERLARSSVHGLGERCRWYLYDPPSNWRASHQSSQSVWSAPDQQPAAITVWHAVPRSRGASARAFSGAIFGEDAAADYTCLAVSTESEIKSRHGLAGTRLQVRGHFPDMAITERSLAVFEDASYVYGLKLEGRDQLYVYVWFQPKGRSAHRQLRLES